MKFDKVIMNPPYCNGLGGKITSEVISLLKDDKDCICLMPLSNYKNKSAELWRKVKTFELADPKLFVDADITNSLCICTLKSSVTDSFKSYEDMQFESFDKRYIEFYRRNKELVMKYHFNSNTARDNFSVWAYSSKTKDSLSNDLIFGLGFDTVSDTCSIAIPQIYWETISDNPLWKKGDYDEAVLDVMGLMWDEEKNNIVRRTK